MFYDQRGHGQSPPADLQGLTTADLAADLDAVLADVGDRLSSIAAAMLVVGSAFDWPPTAADARRIAAAVPGAELVMLEESGHFPWLEEPEAFFTAVQAWLANL